MARDLTSAMSTALTGSVIRPVLIGRLDIVSDPLFAWTGPGTFAPSGSGDAALDGQTFFNLAPFFELSDVVEDQGIGGPVTITVAGHDLDEDLLRQVVRDKRQWRGQPAYLWLGLLNDDQATVVADPVRIKAGVMTQMKTTRNEDRALVQVTIDRDLGNSETAPYRWIDHGRYHTSDTWSHYIVALANKPSGPERRDLRGRGGTPLRRGRNSRRRVYD